MPTIPLHPPSPSRKTSTNPLPPLLQTPSGLAILELQGTIHLPTSTFSSSPEEKQAKRPRLSPSESNPATDPDNDDKGATQPRQGTQVGRLVFPLYDPTKLVEEQGEKWMKRVYFYVGNHQRMTGEVRKLGKPVAVVRRREGGSGKLGSGEGHGGGGTGAGEGGEGMVVDSEGWAAGQSMGEEGTGDKEELEIVEIVKYKIVFTSRPEPVSGEGG
ncbi:Hypothetical protein D9617_11g008630 [Elsinoe fawcettii]|nr:Hypothetical protein D9617_11g008630 [Elsinoe fawcettii]